VVSLSEEQTRSIGSRLGELLKPGLLVGLRGDLGAGKTRFVQGLARGLAIPDEEVSSPTFVLCHVYRGRLTLLHVDVYRLRTIDEFRDLAVDEALDSGAAVVVEWSDRVEPALPEDRIDVQLDDVGVDRRRLRIAGLGPVSREVVARWK
jgi:tRNA threonylcarbamoyladenosine biosynthesis protein TsaE